MDRLFVMVCESVRQLHVFRFSQLQGSVRLKVRRRKKRVSKPILVRKFGTAVDVPAGGLVHFETFL